MIKEILESDKKVREIVLTEVANPFGKTRPVDKPYEIWKSKDGTWTWKVLKKWQINDDKPYARWFCAVTSPFTSGDGDLGDVYVSEIKDNATKVWSETEGDKNA